MEQESPSLHAIIKPGFKRAIVSSFVDRMAAAGRSLATTSKELGGSPESFLRGMIVWNFVLNALEAIMMSHTEVGLSMERRGRLRIFRYGELTFLPYSTQKTVETPWGSPMALTAQDKRYVAKLFREHKQERLGFDDETPRDPLPAILAYNAMAAQNDDGSPTVRLETLHFAFPTHISSTGAIGLDLGPAALQVYPAPNISVAVEPERAFDPAAIKLRLIKNREESGHESS